MNYIQIKKLTHLIQKMNYSTYVVSHNLANTNIYNNPSNKKPSPKVDVYLYLLAVLSDKQITQKDTVFNPSTKMKLSLTY